MEERIARPVKLLAAAALFGLLVATISLAGEANGAGGAQAEAAASVERKLNRLQRQVTKLRRRVSRVQKAEITGERLADGAVTSSHVADGTLAAADFSTSIPSARVTHTAAITIPHDTDTFLSWNNERWDTAGIWSISDPTKLTAPEDGIYAITAQITWAADAVGQRQVAVMIGENVNPFAFAVNSPSAGGVLTTQDPTTYVQLQQGDYVRIRVKQTSGGDLNIGKEGAASPEASMTWVAPGP